MGKADLQDMAGITVDGPGNKVIKMADPIRNQSVLLLQLLKWHGDRDG